MSSVPNKTRTSFVKVTIKKKRSIPQKKLHHTKKKGNKTSKTAERFPSKKPT